MPGHTFIPSLQLLFQVSLLSVKLPREGGLAQKLTAPQPGPHGQTPLAYSAGFNCVANLVAPASPNTHQTHRDTWEEGVFPTRNLEQEAFVGLRSEAPTGRTRGNVWSVFMALGRLLRGPFLTSWQINEGNGWF